MNTKELQDYYARNKRPVNNTVKKILIGKLVSFHASYKDPMVILGVRRNSLYGYLEILVGQYNGYSISVYSWYAYQRNNLIFCGRDTKVRIKKCLILNPQHVAWHLGRSIDLKNVQIYERPRNFVKDALMVYDNCNYYRDYCNL